MDVTEKVALLESELSLLKNELKPILIDLRDFLMRQIQEVKSMQETPAPVPPEVPPQAGQQGTSDPAVSEEGNGGDGSTSKKVA